MYLIEKYPILENCIGNIELCIEALVDTYRNGSKVLIAGGGSSIADSEHIAACLLKSFLKKRPISRNISNAMLHTTENKQMAEYIINNLEMPLEAIALTSQSSLNTVFINDREPYLIFAQQMLTLGKNGDTFLAISPSGNDKSIILAANVARALGIRIISFTGEDGGKLSKISDIAIKVPAIEPYKIQEYHLPIYHHICLHVEEAFFTENK